MRILLVDDEAELTAPLAQVLACEGYEVNVAYDGAAGWNLVQLSHYDLLILDWMMPKLSGLELCRRLRSRGDATPVLFLTAKDTLDDRVHGLDAGADDYLIKPFELRELLARVRALLRRSGLGDDASSPRLRVGDLELDCECQIAYCNGRAIALTNKETQLLEYFMHNPERVLSRQQIHEDVWAPGEEPNSNALSALVRLLRCKLDLENASLSIHSVYGKGYRFGAKPKK
ncbi:two component transcriptional regulator, winged-helix family [Rubidibacter lacunae KORDI 51-2]|uniref:Two component transcriptional regulator, winged-helix family n=1 Tax=Rubidibacter lacunae KORDI 51-2 TaxID=582515 RepID=U5DMQ5_9CHRO|nr:two-component system response regulator RppA [Rubidibacter lacunae]ERN42961.1 two component transcriptional regulator, winged-helix family [Rubidibacter lacunae KORDI 51-2]